MGRKKIDGYICERCSHEWVKRMNSTGEPKVCPKCLPPDIIISGSYKRIADLKCGEKVFGVSGKTCKIEKIFKHDWMGELIELKAAGCLPIQITPEHKVFRVHCIQKSNSKKRKFSRTFLKPDLVEAFFLKKSPISENKNDCGDYLIIPKLKPIFNKIKISLKEFTTVHGLKVLKGKNLKDYFLLDNDTSWMLGLYVAEGYSSLSKGEIIFCLGKHEKVLTKKLCTIIKKLGFKCRIVEKETANLVYISSRLFSRAFKKWFGENAKTKKIPAFILLHNDKEVYENFLKGYLEGDGNWRVLKGRARVNANTVSKPLTFQLQLLSIRMNDFFNITKVNFSKYKSNYRGRTIRGGEGFLLRASAGKISSLMGLKKIPRHNKSYKFFDNYVAVPIKNIKRINYSGRVWNIQTEENNYLALNIAVKNCKSPYWDTPRKQKISKAKRGSLS